MVLAAVCAATAIATNNKTVPGVKMREDKTFKSEAGPTQLVWKWKGCEAPAHMQNLFLSCPVPVGVANRPTSSPQPALSWLAELAPRRLLKFVCSWSDLVPALEVLPRDNPA